MASKCVEIFENYQKSQFPTFLHIWVILANLIIPILLEMAKHEFSVQNYLEKAYMPQKCVEIIENYQIL